MTGLPFEWLIEGSRRCCAAPVSERQMQAVGALEIIFAMPASFDLEEELLRLPAEGSPPLPRMSYTSI
jgi:hypothetical protein